MVWCAQLRDAGWQRAKQFSWEKCALETLEVYRPVARDRIGWPPVANAWNQPRNHRQELSFDAGL
jgi:hypothetical protein